jgi:hypothetical protein
MREPLLDNPTPIAAPSVPPSTAGLAMQQGNAAGCNKSAVTNFNRHFSSGQKYNEMT